MFHMMNLMVLPHWNVMLGSVISRQCVVVTVSPMLNFTGCESEPNAQLYSAASPEYHIKHVEFDGAAS